MRPKILFISPVPSHPQDAGNRARVFKLASCLQMMGHEVHFAHIQETPGDGEAMGSAWGANYHPIPYQAPITKSKAYLSKQLSARLLRRIQGLFGSDPRYTFRIDDWYDPGMDVHLAELATKLQPDIIVVAYVFFSRAFNCFSADTLKIIDAQDVFSNRYQLYLKKKQRPRWFSTSPREEAKGLKRADVIFSIQEKETDYYSNRLGHPRVISVGHFIDLVPPQPCEPTRPHQLLFVGSSNPINVQGIRYFLDEVFDRVVAQIPDVQLRLCGGVCDQVPAHPHCLKVGNFEDLRQQYLQADLVINPVLFGTGLKIKTIEALGFSKPLVTTSAGAAGLETGIGKAFAVADTPQVFATSIIKMLSDQAEYRRFSKQAFAFAKDWQETQLKSLSLGLSR